MPRTPLRHNSGVLYDRAVDLLRRYYDRRLPGDPVLDAARYFSQAQRYAGAWRALAAEAAAVAANLGVVPRFHEIMPQQYAISANDARDWRMLIVKAYGHTVARNAARCPVLTQLLATTPEVLSAALSFLAPRKIVPPHRGPFRGVLRFYLGLAVPPGADGRPGAVLTIDGVEHRVASGEWLLWDDSFEHDVRNETDQLRIALLLDVRRRGMPMDLDILSRLVITGVGGAARFQKLD
jgi:aspartate beta-hydroxylase